MNEIIRKYLLLFPALALAAIACDKDDLTGESSLEKTSPAISVDVPANVPNFIEKDTTFEFTITLSEPQIVDVAIYVKQVGGDATLGEDFTIGTSTVIIPATRTTGVASISVLADDTPEATETFTIQIGDERTGNASIDPKTIEFSISNVTEGSLHLDLDWTADVTDATGEPLDGDEIANLTLYVLDADTLTLVSVVNGETFETVEFLEDQPDGKYFIAASIGSSVDFGELGGPVPLTLHLTSFQSGKIPESTLMFPDALTTPTGTCNPNYVVLAEVVKSGSDYEVNEVNMAKTMTFNSVNEFVGDFIAVEPNYGEYPVEFTVVNATTIANDNFWDGAGTVNYVINFNNCTVTIPAQDLPDLSAWGFEEILVVQGSGTYTPFGLMIVNYTVTGKDSGTLYDRNTHTFIPN